MKITVVALFLSKMQDIFYKNLPVRLLHNCIGCMYTDMLTYKTNPTSVNIWDLLLTHSSKKLIILVVSSMDIFKQKLNTAYFCFVSPSACTYGYCNTSSHLYCGVYCTLEWDLLISTRLIATPHCDFLNRFIPDCPSVSW